MPDTHSAEARDFPGTVDTPDDLPEHGGPSGPVHSLADDVSALFDDGKTYLEAELAFQKSRAAYAADRTKSALVFGLGALAFLHLALIALVVGSVLALSSVMSPWLATLLVTAILLAGTVWLGLAAKRRAGEIASAFSDETK